MIIIDKYLTRVIFSLSLKDREVYPPPHISKLFEFSECFVDSINYNDDFK